VTVNPTCSAGFVDCVNGYVSDSGGGTTCELACGGACCVEDACAYFTGKVCKDSVSCMGESACELAKIP
jgi:hypothetical protein